MFGELGDDVIAGGSGNEQISSGWGYDTVSGGGGSNFLVYNRANDTYVATGGQDVARSALAVTANSTILQTNLSSPLARNLAARMVSNPPASISWTGQPHVEPDVYVTVTPASIQAASYPGFGSPGVGATNGGFFSAASVPPVRMPVQTFVQTTSWSAPVLPPLAPTFSAARDWAGANETFAQALVRLAPLLPVTGPSYAEGQGLAVTADVMAAAMDQVSGSIQQAVSLPPAASGLPAQVLTPTPVVASGLVMDGLAPVDSAPAALQPGALAGVTPTNPQGQNTGLDRSPVGDPAAWNLFDQGIAAAPTSPVFGNMVWAPMAPVAPAVSVMDGYQPALALSGGGIVSAPMGKSTMDESPSSDGLMGPSFRRPEVSQLGSATVSSGIAREVVSMDRLIRAIRESEITVRLGSSDPFHDDGSDLRVFDETRGLFVARSVDHDSYVIDLGPVPVAAHLEEGNAEEGGPMGLEEGAMIVPGPSWVSFLKRFGRW